MKYSLIIILGLTIIVVIGGLFSLAVKKMEVSVGGGGYTFSQSMTNASTSLKNETSTLIAVENPNRVFLRIMNTTNSDVYCAFTRGNFATTTAPLKMAQKESYEINSDNLYIGAISCRPDAATSTISIMY